MLRRVPGGRTETMIILNANYLESLKLAIYKSTLSNTASGVKVCEGSRWTAL